MNASASETSRPLLGPLLRDVSRSFYLTVRVLPWSVRPQIGMAYLLARATDTLADTALVPVTDRLHALDQLRERILTGTCAALNFTPFTRADAPRVPAGAASPAERELLERIEEVLAAIHQFRSQDQQHIRQVLATIISGQQLDLRRFATPAPGPQPVVRALESDAELDDYTYRVAGCVGEFWTRICRAHLFPWAALDDARLLTDGVRFGKGLQLVNILRDIPADLRNGRCYVPRDALHAVGLAPEDLLDPKNEPRFRPIYEHWLACAEAHLRAGWDYTTSLPWRCARVRCACSWPILIGIHTLARLRSSPVLVPDQRVKISRARVRQILARTLFLYPFPSLWRRLHKQASRT